MRHNERRMDGQRFSRRKATADTKRKVSGWEVWEYHDVDFEHIYDRTVTLYVNEGRAELIFDNGETVDIQTGDTLTIEAGAKAHWTIEPPIRNSYCYHDSFSSAESRTSQVHWHGKQA